MRSPAMATSLPFSFTPQKVPSRCVRAMKGPGFVSVARASISGASASVSRSTRPVGIERHERLRHHLNARRGHLRDGAGGGGLSPT